MFCSASHTSSRDVDDEPAGVTIDCIVELSVTDLGPVDDLRLAGYDGDSVDSLIDSSSYMRLQAGGMRE